MVKNIIRKRKPDIDYNWVDSDKDILKKMMRDKPFAFVRAGDAELRILEGRRIYNSKSRLNSSKKFINKLALSLERADLVGLPQDYISKTKLHSLNWDKLIVDRCKALGYTVSKERIGAMIFYHAPELIGEIVAYKKVLWINHRAFSFSKLLKNKDFCNYYNLSNIVSNSYIEIPDGKGGWIFENNMDNVLDYICLESKKLVNDFDIAVIGAGAMANYASIFIRDYLNRQALDVGAVLSAMRGHANRGTFRTGNSQCLVWLQSKNMVK